MKSELTFLKVSVRYKHDVKPASEDKRTLSYYYMYWYIWLKYQKWQKNT